MSTLTMSHDTAQPSVQPRSVIKKDDGVLAYYFSAQIANLIVRMLRQLPITPNHYTIASLLLGFVAAWLFAQGSSNGMLWGLLALHISFIFDCCDGQVSRLKGLASRMGHWFDYHADKLKDGAVLFGWAYGIYVLSDERSVWVFWIVFVTIFFQFLRNITALNRDNFMLETQGKKDAPHPLIATGAGSNAGSQFLRTVKNSSLFKLSDRVLLYTIFGLLNLAWVGLVVYACLEVLYAISSAALNYRMFHRYDITQR